MSDIVLINPVAGGGRARGSRSLPANPRGTDGGSWAASIVNSRAVAGLVIKELFRRKDFYALFILTALITLILGSVNFFNEAHVVRYLKELCLFLIWVSSLVIAITTAARQIPA